MFSLSSPSRALVPWRWLVSAAAVLSALTACGPAELPASPSALKQVSALSAPAQVSSELSLSTALSGRITANPVVAAGGGLYLAVWRESAPGQPTGLVGVRIRASDGAMLDASPFSIAPTPVDYEPAVAFDGTHFLVVWQDTQIIPTVRGARVRASDGAVLDAFPRYSPSTTQDAYMYPAVAFDGTSYVVVWSASLYEGGTYVPRIQGIRIRPSDGLPIEPAPFLIAAERGAPKVVSGGGYSLVTWATNGPVRGVRLNTSGQVLDTAPVTLTASTALVVQVASQGSSFLVAWVDSSNALRATRVRAQDGVRLGPPDILLDSAAAISSSMPNMLSVTFDGVDYQVLWPALRGGVRTLLNARVSAAGTVAAGSEVAVSTYHGSTAPDWVGIAAAEPGRFLAVYSQHVPALGMGRPMARRVDHVRASLSPMLAVGPAAFSQHAPAVAAGAGHYLVAWAESHPSTPSDTHVFAVRVDAATGAVLDSPPLLVSQSAGLWGDRRDAAVAFAGGNFLVVWTETLNGPPVIKGVRVRASDGALLEAPQQVGGFFAPAPDETPTVASDGTNFLVAWSGWVGDSGPPQWGVQLTRIRSSDGQRVPGSNLFLAPGGGRPRATYGDGRFLVAWHVSNQGYNTYGAWIDAATGTLTGNSPFSLASSVADENLVGVASSGSQFLVALRVGYSRVRALRITGSATGWLLDSPSLVVAESSATPPGVAFDGESYRVAWQGPTEGAREVYSMRVSTQGQLGVGEEYGFSSVPANSRTDAPGIASVGPGRFLVAWSQNEGGANRVRIRLVNEVP